MAVCRRCWVPVLWRQRLAARGVCGLHGWGGTPGLNDADELFEDSVLLACEHCDLVSGLHEPQCKAWLVEAMEFRVKRLRRNQRFLETCLKTLALRQAGDGALVKGVENSPERTIIAEERRASVERALGACLSPRHEALVRARFWEDLSVDEIAEREHVSRSWVYKSLERIFERLRGALHELAEDGS